MRHSSDFGLTRESKGAAAVDQEPSAAGTKDAKKLSISAWFGPRVAAGYCILKIQFCRMTQSRTSASPTIEKAAKRTTGAHYRRFPAGSQPPLPVFETWVFRSGRDAYWFTEHDMPNPARS
jgi:hypothetical protein